MGFNLDSCPLNVPVHLEFRTDDRIDGRTHFYYTYVCTRHAMVVSQRQNRKNDRGKKKTPGAGRGRSERDGSRERAIEQERKRLSGEEQERRLIIYRRKRVLVF